jgi:hypothetical protein
MKVLWILNFFSSFKRSFIYTARIKSNKRVNFLENGLAFIFCTVNGLQIGHYHTIFSSHNLFKWNFIMGIFDLHFMVSDAIRILNSNIRKCFVLHRLDYKYRLGQSFAQIKNYFDKIGLQNSNR